MTLPKWGNESYIPHSNFTRKAVSLRRLLSCFCLVPFCRARVTRGGQISQTTILVGERQANVQANSMLTEPSRTSRTTQQSDENITGLFHQYVSDKISLTPFEIVLSQISQPLLPAQADAVMEQIDHLIYQATLNQSWFKEALNSTGHSVSLSFESSISNQTVISTSSLNDEHTNDGRNASSNIHEHLNLLYMQVAKDATVTYWSSVSTTPQPLTLPTTQDFRVAVKQAFDSAEELGVAKQELLKAFPKEFSNLESIKFSRFLNASDVRTRDSEYDGSPPDWDLIGGMFFLGAFVMALFVCSLFGMLQGRKHRRAKADENLSDRLSRQTALRAVAALDEYNFALSIYKHALEVFQNSEPDENTDSERLDQLRKQHEYVTFLYDKASELWETLGETFPSHHSSRRSKSKHISKTAGAGNQL